MSNQWIQIWHSLDQQPIMVGSNVRISSRRKNMRISMRLVITSAALFAIVIVTGSVMDTHAKSPFQQVPESKVNKEHRSIAKKAAIDTMANWRDGKYEPLSDDYTEAMKEASTPARQKAAYQNIKALFGDLKDLKYVEAVASKNLPSLVVYRFKGTFTGTKDKPEIRVVIDSDGKIAGFFIKPWKDELQ
jgi:hypothetical protein